jgi:hypothetical protein
MTQSSSRMQWPYPTREDDPWFDYFEDLVRGQDASGYAHREDNSIIWTGGGTVSWDLATETLTWTGTISIYSPIGSRLLQIAADSIAGWKNGEVAYVVLTRQPLANVTASLVKSSQLPSNDNSRSFAVRVGDVIFFRTGMSLGDGDSSDGIAPVPGGGGGGAVVDLFLGGDYSYTRPVSPVEEVIGNNSFDGSVGVTSLYFKASVTNLFATTGTTQVRLYDMGPAAGPPDLTPRLVATLNFSNQGGPRASSQVLTVVSATPGANEILDQDRMYEVAVVQVSGTAGDLAYIGSASLELLQ